MSAPPASNPPHPAPFSPALTPAATSPLTIFQAIIVIIVAGLVAYSRSFTGPFIYDDFASIAANPTIQHGLRLALMPPLDGQTVTGRPLVNLSLALNYSLDYFNIWGYHAVNLAIHLLAGLALFGLARRTLAQPAWRARFANSALPLGLAIALLWMLHPLQTESVTYIVQRAEAMMGLFYLLTLYCFVRGAESPQPQKWDAFSVIACLLGMFCKEIMVTAPLMVLLYDRTFVAGTFAQAWRQRRRLYIALACTWIPLILLVASAGNRGRTAGFGTGVDPWAYALAQFQAVVEYLWLSFWPHPLTLDYGQSLTNQVSDVAPYAFAVLVLAVGTVYALWRRPILGFAGAWFFAILAPSSSIVPVAAQTMAEHRMYLPLAAIMAILVLALHALVGRRAFAAALTLALALGGLTLERNENYGTTVGVWSESVRQDPSSIHQHLRLATDLGNAGRLEEGLQEYRHILRLNPNDASAENTLGAFLAFLGRKDEAIVHYQKSISLNPRVEAVHENLGEVLTMLRRLDEAAKEYTEAIRLKPDYAVAHYGLGTIFLQTNRIPEAIVQYETALKFQPNFADAEYNLGNALSMSGQWEEARQHYQEATWLRPNYAVAFYGAGNALVQLNRVDDARQQYEMAVRLAPGFAEAHNNLGFCLLRLGRPAEALREYQAVLKINPHSATASKGVDEAQQKLAAPPNAATAQP